MFTDSIQGHAVIRFDDHFIMDMHNDGAVAERSHGVEENITRGGLYNIFYKLWSVGIKTFPLVGPMPS